MTSRWSLLRLASATLLFLALLAPEARSQSSGIIDHRPIWMPDGRAIVFMSDRAGGDFELYRLALDGSELVRLTRHEGWDGYAAVSSDGHWLAFDRGEADEKQIVLLELSSGEERVLLRSDVFLGGAKWSPSGDRLVFTWEKEGQRDLYLIRPDGRGLKSVATTPINEGDPSFSPDGRSIVSAVTLERGEGSALEVLELDSGRRQRILTSPGRIYGTDWSPDGARIAFNSDEDGDHEIFVVDATGANRRRITNNDVTDHLPQWSPDGRRLMFTSERGDREIVIIVDADGGYAFQLATR